MVFLIQPLIAFVNGKKVINEPVTKPLATSTSEGLCGCVSGEFTGWTSKLINTTRQNRKRTSKKGAADSSSIFSFGKSKHDLKKAKDHFQIREARLVQIKMFSKKELQTATGNFSKKNQVGKGGFGRVYKGKLPDGSSVAVKRLDRPTKKISTVEETQFLAELLMSSVAIHSNLLPLYGYCQSEKERLLVYPFVPNGNLQRHLPGCTLDWTKRQKIALGIARGLAYMHEFGQLRIIHRDVKPSNILLSDNFEPLLTDFGLARPMEKAADPYFPNPISNNGWSNFKYVDDGVSHITTAVIGTHGYVAPECLINEQISEKADVYSFGITILQLVAGRESTHWRENGDKINLIEWARELVRDDKIDAIIDSKLQNEDDNLKEEFLQMVKVGILCTSFNPKDRPQMSQVIRLLKGAETTIGWREIDKALASANQHSIDADQYTSHVREDDELDLVSTGTVIMDEDYFVGDDDDAHMFGINNLNQDKNAVFPSRDDEQDSFITCINDNEGAQVTDYNPDNGKNRIPRIPLIYILQFVFILCHIFTLYKAFTK